MPGGQYTVTIDGDEKLIKELLKISTSIGVNSENLLDQMAVEAKMLLSTNAPKSQGHLSESMNILYATKGERHIGPGTAGPSTQFPPSHYARYVEEGGGPTSVMPNVEDIMARFGLNLRQGIIFSKYLRDSGRAVRTANPFVKNTARQMQSTYLASAQRMINRLIT